MKKKSHSEFVQEINGINPAINVLGEYVNTNTKILCECKECGHQWLVRPYSLIGGTGCPNCAGNIKKTNESFIIELYNLAPEIEVIGSYSGWAHKIRVRCSICGNEWSPTAGKLLNGRGCPKCNFKHHSSFPEQAIYYYVHKAYPDSISSYHDRGYELDIYIPSIKVAIEYDGFLWRSSRISKDDIKDKKCKDDGITLIRIREKGLQRTENSINIIRKDNYSTDDLDYCIELIFDILGASAKDINTAKDRQIILSTYLNGRIKNSFAVTHIELAREWDMKKNNGLLPEMFSSGSSESINWVCHICGHCWRATISDRVNGNGCPACSRRVATKGKNDIATLFPQIAAEWSYGKNDSMMPEDFLPGSSKSVWWKCKICGGEWEASIGNRCKKNGTSCPFCSGRVARSGKNDLKTVNPSLAEEWHPTNNGILKPETVLPNSNKKVWWRCNKCGYEWQTAISSRNKGSSCPKCAQEKRVKAFNQHITKGGNNTLKTSNPQLANDWHPSKNGELMPNNVSPRSGKKVWWKCCFCGYEWQATIANRNKTNGTGCPACAGKVK